MNAADKEERQARHRAIRNRIALIAAERRLPESEIRKVIGRLSTRDVLHFAEKHCVQLGLADLRRSERTSRNREGLPIPAGS